MNRSKFLSSIGVLGFAPVLGLNSCKNQETEDVEQLRKELLDAWLRSERMTLINMEQMPAESYFYKYTKEAMTFSEQWRHCVIYTFSQLSGCTGVENPYKGIKLPVQMPKEEVIGEIKKMYDFVRSCITSLSYEKLHMECDFAGDVIPVWRLFYALENHIIHHRGQCIVYLRLNGVVPKGYYGW